MQLVFKILLPCAFEYIDSIQLPTFESAGAYAKEVGVLFSCQTEFIAFLTDLLTLVEIEKHVIIVKQIGDGDFIELGELLHMFDWVVILAAFFIGRVGCAIDAQEVGDILLEKCFIISIPAELVRYFGNLRRLGEADIELFGLK